jgi:hypothetical protein
LVDKALIFRKISELETYQKQIREFADITLRYSVSDEGKKGGRCSVVERIGKETLES